MPFKQQRFGAGWHALSKAKGRVPRLCEPCAAVHELAWPISTSHGSQSRGTQRRGRRGVTLLEVLVAIMVLSVGLLSLAALIPIGRHEMAEAGKVDRATTLGRAAFRDLLIRGLLRPEMWLTPGSGTGTPVLQGPHFVTGSGTVGPPLGPLVLDPLMLWPESIPASGLAGHMAIASVFPHLVNDVGAGWPEGTVPKIPRITLRAFPDTLGMMNYDTANRFFRSNDDLVFSVPEDRADRPWQVYHEGPTELRTWSMRPRGMPSTEQALRPVFREFQGDFSWFVTLSPVDRELITFDPANGAYRLPDPNNPSELVLANAATVKQFSVSVVVCHKRKVNNLGAEEDLRETRGERMCWVDFLGEREARLRVEGYKLESEAAAALRIKAGEWIALVGTFTDPWLKQKKVRLQWYQVVATGDRPVQPSPDSTSWYLDAKLDGRPWVTLNDKNELAFSFDDASSFSYSDTSFTTGGSEMPTAWGIIVDDVIAVYEKTVALDGRSLWSP